MATPPRVAILENVLAVLPTILTINGYKSSVQKVERLFRDPSDQAVGVGVSLPWLGVWFAKQTTEHHPFGQLKITLPATIVGYVAGADSQARSAAIGNLEDDLIFALELDTTRAGNAMRTNIGDTETEEGNDTEGETNGGIGTLVMPIEIVYWRTVQAS